MADPRQPPSDRGSAAVSSLQRLSVVISNYNYADYVGAAVESALAVDWPDVEVIVVDDGSTDGSRDVLEQYAQRATVVLTANRGQVSAVNTGFSASTGDVVAFLDSDDVLPRDLAQQLHGLWSSSTSKAQFRMQRIDRDGRPIGTAFPTHRRTPTPSQVRRWMVRTTAYPTPPASGNVYARWYLSMIMPLTEELGRYADSSCLAAAPILGDVITVPGVVVGYRQHGANDSNLLAVPGRFTREVERAANRWRFARRHAAATGIAQDLTDAALRRSRELLQFRLAAARLEDAYPLAGDGRLTQLIDVLRSPWHPGPEDLRTRLLIMAWCILAWSLPRRGVWKLAGLRWGRSAS